MSVLAVLLDCLADDVAQLEREHVCAVAEAATYRQMLLMALELCEVERRRADAAVLRLQQVMGREAWHPEEERPNGR